MRVRRHIEASGCGFQAGLQARETSLGGFQALGPDKIVGPAGCARPVRTLTARTLKNSECDLARTAPWLKARGRRIEDAYGVAPPPPNHFLQALDVRKLKGTGETSCASLSLLGII